MPTLSVIIPVYNTKEYLNQCIESIISQSYTDMEIIIVDDGSTDGSGEVCDKYKDVDKRIKVFHQENKGLISARYTGVENAKGEYVGFVDSDDWIAEDMYEQLMMTAKAEHCDIVSVGYVAVSGEMTQEADDGTLFGIYEKGENMDIAFSNMMYDAREQRRGIQPSLCCKVIIRSLLLDAISKVDKGISLGEDAAVFYPCCLKAERICVLREYKYYYRFHDGSMCRSFDIETFEKIRCFNQYMKYSMAELKDRYNISEQIRMYVWDFINNALGKGFGFRVCVPPIFPCNVVEKGCNIILYGAGKVGQSYYAQILENNYCNIVAWADKDDNRIGELIRPAQIKEENYSKIVIAVKNKVMADEIEQELIELGVSKEKIVWAEPQRIQKVSLNVV